MQTRPGWLRSTRLVAWMYSAVRILSPTSDKAPPSCARSRLRSRNPQSECQIGTLRFVEWVSASDLQRWGTPQVTRSTLHKHGPRLCNPGANDGAVLRPLSFVCSPTLQKSPLAASTPAPIRSSSQTSSANTPKISQHDVRSQFHGTLNHSIPIDSLTAYCKSPYRERPGPTTLASTDLVSPGRPRYSAKDFALDIR